MRHQLVPHKKKTSSIHTGLFLSFFFTGLVTQGFCDGETSQSTFDSAQTYPLAQVEQPTKKTSQLTSDATETYSVFQVPNPTVEGKAGYFFFTNSIMKDIYTKGGLDVQIAGSYPICKGLSLYGSVEYLERSGKSLNDHQDTKIWLIPANLGLRPVFTLCKQVQYYFTFGPRYFYVHQHNESSYVPKNIARSGLGLFVNTGFTFLPWGGLLLDIFGEYSYAKAQFHDEKNNVYGEDTQLSGLTFGGGIGYAF